MGKKGNVPELRRICGYFNHAAAAFYFLVSFMASKMRRSDSHLPEIYYNFILC